jgi:hypothetical protein
LFPAPAGFDVVLWKAPYVVGVQYFGELFECDALRVVWYDSTSIFTVEAPRVFETPMAAGKWFELAVKV